MEQSRSYALHIVEIHADDKASVGNKTRVNGEMCCETQVYRSKVTFAGLVYRNGSTQSRDV